MLDGLLLVDKHPNCTSHDVVQRVRRLLRQRKVGHCGTLDPGATGLLTITAGKATRLTRFLVRAPKVYAGWIRFGVTTDTYDAGGEVTDVQPIGDLDPAAIRLAMERFVGRYEQVAPPFSAKKHRGVRYYEMARRGEKVPEARKDVEVFEFAATGDLVDGRIPFRVGCSSGTYVRSLAHELGAALGCGAHLAELRRLKVGPFQLEQALDLEELERREAAGEPLAPAWIALDEIPLPFGDLVVDAQQERRVVSGQTVLMRPVSSQEGDWVKLINRRRQLLAVGTVVETIGGNGVGVVQPRIVFR
jgi:tRNA pseudouridine55 synthase